MTQSKSPKMRCELLCAELRDAGARRWCGSRDDLRRARSLNDIADGEHLRPRNRVDASRTREPHQGRHGRPPGNEKTAWSRGLFGSPNGIRTRVTALRGRRPRPLDDRAAGSRRWTRTINPQVQSLVLNQLSYPGSKPDAFSFFEGCSWQQTFRSGCGSSGRASAGFRDDGRQECR